MTKRNGGGVSAPGSPKKSSKNQVISWSPQEGPQTAFLHFGGSECFFGGARGG